VQLVATTIFGQGARESCMPFSILGANVLRYFCSQERKYQGTKVPGSESSRERKFHPWNFAPGSESTWERKFQLPVNAHKQRNKASIARTGNTE